MNLAFAFLAGAAVGLAFFGGLWLTVRRVLSPWDRFSNLSGSGVTNHRGPGAAADAMTRTGWKTCPTGTFGVSRTVRFALSALVFWGLARGGGASLCAGLAGFWLARWGLVLGLGVVGAR